jgi:hypothetical protein
MHKILLLVTVMVICTSGKAAEFLDGYVILASKDTVKCQFRTSTLRKFSPFYEIRVVMEGGEEQAFRAKDKKILGYGFRDLGIAYDFWYIEMKQKSESGFYQQLINGPKYRLYSHMLSSSTYPGISMNHAQYVLFNAAGEWVKFETCVLCPWKKGMREVFKDDAKALEALANASYPINVPKFVAEVNK